MTLKLCAAAMLAIALVACSPKQVAAEAKPPVACAPEGQPGANDACDLKADARTLRAKFGPAPHDNNGTIEVEVLGADGAVQQVMTEKGTGDYFYPVVKDVDEDGHADLLIIRQGGAVNAEQALWRQGADGKFVRLGEVSGVSLAKMPSGFLSVPARSSAAEWEVRFYQMSETTLTPIATVSTTAEKSADGQELKGTTCKLIEQPGISGLHLTAAAAEKQFCGDPSVTILFAE